MHQSQLLVACSDHVWWDVQAQRMISRWVLPSCPLCQRHEVSLSSEIKGRYGYAMLEASYLELALEPQNHTGNELSIVILLSCKRHWIGQSTWRIFRHGAFRNEIIGESTARAKPGSVLRQVNTVSMPSPHCWVNIRLLCSSQNHRISLVKSFSSF